MVRPDFEMERSAGLTRPADALRNGILFILCGMLLGSNRSENNRQMQSKAMNRLQLVVYPLRDVLLGWKQIGDILGEENPMLLPELFYEANESAVLILLRAALCLHQIAAYIGGQTGVTHVNFF